ncbi:hypothetical protein ACU4GD_05550 [Cupriavidus basilensis]
MVQITTCCARTLPFAVLTRQRCLSLSRRRGQEVIAEMEFVLLARSQRPRSCRCV